MGTIDRMLVVAIAQAPTSTVKTAVILRLSEPCGDQQKSRIELCGVEIDTISNKVVTGNIAIGKIRNLSHLPFILSIQTPTEHHLANKA